MSWAPSHEPEMPYVDAEQALSATKDFWTEWSVTCRLPGRAVQRRRRPVDHHPEGPDLRTDRRDRRGRDHVAAGGTRRRPQLGLPVLLASRRHLRAAGPARGRFQARSRGVARLAAARHSRSAGGAADPVQHRRRAAAARGRAALARRLRRQQPGPHRQRRVRSASSSTSGARPWTPCSSPGRQVCPPTPTRGHCRSP